MKNIYTIISEMTIENIKELKFLYQDTLSINQSDMCPYSYNYWLWKYYTGMITKDENDMIQEWVKPWTQECENLKSIYNVIFEIQKAPDSYKDIHDYISTLKRDNNFSNEITDLWLMRPENFQYEEAFKKLIFMLYVLYGEDKFRTIALDFYLRNEKARAYVERYCEDEKARAYVERYCENDVKHRFLILRSKDDAYNQYYSIEKHQSDKHSMHTNSMEEEQNKTQDDDWIVEYFG